jgi:hypothetical protein
VTCYATSSGQYGSLRVCLPREHAAFVAGEPKSWKSWFGYDLALSVSTGADFLGAFRVVSPGPVLYVQEEDPLPTLKTRGAKIWSGKSIDQLELDSEGGIYWMPSEQEKTFDPDINAYVQQGVTLSDEVWQMWLDETLEEGMSKIPYKLMIDRHSDDDRG